jgi:peptidoglycan L-alanyl-D-glutamate endopeptidase CwlK
LGVKLRWGGNWDRDGEPVTDQDFQDLVHFELAED